jgi:hypothetical protein
MHHSLSTESLEEVIKCVVGHATVIAVGTVVVDQSKMMLIYAPADQPLETAYPIVFQEKG